MWALVSAAVKQSKAGSSSLSPSLKSEVVSQMETNQKTVTENIKLRTEDVDDAA